MTSPLSHRDVCDIQRVVLCSPRVSRVRHIAVRFDEGGAARRFLLNAIDKLPATPACFPGQPHDKAPPQVQVSFGFSFRGLDELALSDAVLANFPSRAPAFASGAPLRAAQYLGDHGESRAADWDPAFGLDAAHCVISLHADQEGFLNNATALIKAAASNGNRESPALATLSCFDGGKLKLPAGRPDGETWVHFGLRDALSRVALRGWDDRSDPALGAPEPNGAKQILETSWHRLGEFLLGYKNDQGCNPWGLADARGPVREFFRNASFGVLRIMEQKEDRFRAFVNCKARELEKQKLPTPDMTLPQIENYVKAKLSGRWPDGDRFVGGAWNKPGGVKPEEDFDYRDDQRGLGCPFGSHARRMNPRADPATQEGRDARRRPLLRRGLPYGPAYLEGEKNTERGLLGLFFCASIEDQFEHLVGQWAERVPLGSADRGLAKDPLTGNHEDPDAVFEIPLFGARPVALKGLEPFTRTRGTVYLFYPGITTLRNMLAGEVAKRLWDEEVELRRA